MPETTPLIKAALNLRVGAGFDVYGMSRAGGFPKACICAGFRHLFYQMALVWLYL